MRMSSTLSRTGIREPLNNLVLLGSMLGETGTTPKQQELIDTVLASTGTMVEVVNELTMETAGNMTSERERRDTLQARTDHPGHIELMKLKKRHLQSLIVYDDRVKGARNTMVTRSSQTDTYRSSECCHLRRTGKITIKIQVREPAIHDGLQKVSSPCHQTTLWCSSVEGVSPILSRAGLSIIRQASGRRHRGWFRIIFCIHYKPSSG